MYYQFAVGVGQSVPMAVRGRYVRYWKVTAGEANPAILIRGDGGLQVPLMPGQSFAMPQSWTHITVENFDGVESIAGILLIGDLDFTDNRITGEVAVQGTVNVAGEVSVISGELSRVDAGEAFIASSSLTPTAGQVGGVQLWNPVGSGKIIYLNRVTAYSNTAASFFIGRYSQTALTTLGGAVNSKKLGTGSGGSLSEMRTQSQASGSGTIFGATSASAKNELAELIVTEPIRIPEGYGVNIYGDISNHVNATFQWIEGV